MPRIEAYEHGYGKSWTDVCVVSREGYSTSVTDYHEHGFYEINLILSGNVKILLGDRSEEGAGSRIVLTRPGTPHYISCKPDTLYSRQYLLFSDAFVAGRFSEWGALSEVFGARGRCIALTTAQTEAFAALIGQIGIETAPFRCQLLIYYLLSRLSELVETGGRQRKAPPYVSEALSYIEAHYAERIVAEELARRLHVGRTALMTSFKRYTDSTVGEYLTRCRLRNALRILSDGKTLEYAAEQCGFSDSSGLVRSFKKHYGMTPKQYLSENGSPFL